MYSRVSNVAPVSDPTGPNHPTMPLHARYMLEAIAVAENASNAGAGVPCLPFSFDRLVRTRKVPVVAYRVARNDSQRGRTLRAL